MPSEGGQKGSIMIHKKMKAEKLAEQKESGRRYRGDAHVGGTAYVVTKIDVGSRKKFQLSRKLT
jgi:hypothetical protein